MRKQDLGLQCETPLSFKLKPVCSKQGSFLENLGKDSSCCSCYQAKVKSTPSLKPKSGVWQYWN